MVSPSTNHPTLREQTVFAHTPSIGSSPIAAVTRFPFRGKIVKAGHIANGAWTGTLSHAVNIIASVADGSAPGAGTAVTGSPFTQSATNSAAGSTASFIPTGANTGNEDDLITFTPSGATASSVSGTYYAVIQMA